MIADWRNIYLRPNGTQNVMNIYLAVMVLMPVILLVFTLVSFTQEAFIRDVSSNSLNYQHVA